MEELELLDPCCYWNYGSQTLIGCIDDIENHNYRTPEYRFDASGKGAFGRWRAMVDVIRRWMHAVGRGGCKMEDGDGGRMGNPAEFSFPKLNRIDTFLDVCRN